MAIYTPEDEYDAEELKDLTLAIGLLTGGWDAQKSAKRYYNASEEKLARKAIALLLRNQKPFDSALRRQLAALFDLDEEQEPYASFAGPMERKLIFEFRRPGKPDVTLRDLHMASDYRALIESGSAHKRSVDQICKKYGVSDTTLKEARKRHPKLQPRKAVIKARNRPG